MKMYCRELTLLILVLFLNGCLPFPHRIITEYGVNHIKRDDRDTLKAMFEQAELVVECKVIHAAILVTSGTNVTSGWNGLEILPLSFIKGSTSTNQLKIFNLEKIEYCGSSSIFQSHPIEGEQCVMFLVPCKDVISSAGQMAYWSLGILRKCQ